MADAEKQRVRPQYRRTAVWHAHSAASGAGRLLKHWLEDRGSLTARLVARCQHFRVQKLSQQLAGSLADEFAALGLAQRVRVHQREVILRCDGVPVIYGHTVVPLSASHQQWPLFSSLGERSLGSTLFSDPLVRRGDLQFARLPSGHPLMQRIYREMPELRAYQSLPARRSLFWRKGACLMVTEVFLPAVLQLPPAAVVNTINRKQQPALAQLAVSLNQA